jgi:IS5 family transposase
MRKKFEQQLKVDSIPIEKVTLPLKSRDELPPVLRALQYVYSTPSLNEDIFSILEMHVLKDKKATGRLGMSLWEILVLATVRLCLDTDYDRLHMMSNYDKLLRMILGVETNFGESKKYGLQTIKDNVQLLDEQVINKINDIVVKAGHSLKKKEEALRLKADTYVLETNIHFPTDINLQWDAGRKCLDTVKLLSEKYGIEGWRKLKYWYRNFKNTYRCLSKVCFGPGRKNENTIKELTTQYLRLAKGLEEKISESITRGYEQLIFNDDLILLVIVMELEKYLQYLKKLSKLVERRLLNGEKIPSEDKIYSIFEPHTEWLSKGKLGGKKVELGHNILVVSDQYDFIVHHKVVEKIADAQLTVPTVQSIKEKFTDKQIDSISFDKNFYSKENKEQVSELVNKVIMPKKGKRSIDEKNEEETKEFKTLKNKHSAIEANINQLENNGLNRCPDKGLKNYKRYVALGVLSYNLHHLGKLLKKEDEKNKKVIKQAA